MKNTMFVVQTEQCTWKENQSTNKDKYPHILEIEVPTLDAYSVEYITLTINNLATVATLDDISDTVVRVYAEAVFREINELFMVVQYRGIKDYTKLFPWISNEQYKLRVGRYYEEMDITFENGAWLSFSLCVAAVIEGMLFAKIGFPNSDNRLSDLLTRARSESVINEHDFQILDRARRYRNLVHSNRYREEYISRKEALDMRTTIDSTIKKFANVGTPVIS